MRIVRQTVVRLLWKVIDKVADQLAAKASLPAGVTVVADLPYIEDGLRYHRLDVYYPHSEGQVPVILYIHGGAFIAGDKLHARHYCTQLASEGYAVFNINYRLAPHATNPAQIEDVLSALLWVRENCHSYCGDASRLFLAGESAGAYLAGLAACICSNASLSGRLHSARLTAAVEVQGVLLFSGLYDLETASRRKFPTIRSCIEMLLGTDSNAHEQYKRSYSVLHNFNGQYPPAFISSGEVDGLHPESAALAAVLTKNGVPHKTLFFAKEERKAIHSYQQHLHLEPAKLCMQQVLAFLREIAGKGAVR